MHDMQINITDVRGVCPSVCLSYGSTVCDAFVQPLPNYFGLLFDFCIIVTVNSVDYDGPAYCY